MALLAAGRDNPIYVRLVQGRPLRGAVALANRTDFGLAAYAFADSLYRATGIIEEREAGWVGINTFMPALSEAPFGGYKLSGIGAEGGLEGLLAYTRQKFVSQLAGPWSST
ncbi:MAG: aldehyde dehydrogenase family protein [Myxococcota bacterium]